MPAIRLVCPNCSRTLEIDDDFLGQEIECGACLRAFTAGPSLDRTSKPPSAKSVRSRPDIAPQKSGADRKPSRRKREGELEAEYDDDDFDPQPSRRNRSRANPEGRSRTAYILLGLFFGGLGLHNFYAGRYSVGFVQLFIMLFSIALVLSLLVFCPIGILGFATAFIPCLWAYVEIIVVDRDGNGEPMT